MAISRPVRHSFDQLAKRIGREALGPSGPTVVQDEISRDAQYADIRHDPDPTREAERARLGLLGRLAAVLCLLEIYGHAPNAEEFRACVGKHIAFWEQRARKARAHAKQKRKQKKPGAFVEPFLWIIAAGAPTSILVKLKLDPAPGWPAGVYFFGDDIFRVGLVVASELPRDRSTLLVRLMAAGPLLPHAIADLSALPEGAHERAVAQQILLSLQHALGNKQSQTPEEQEFIVTMHNTWEKARELGWEKGRELGRDEGQLTGVRLSLRRVLAARKLTPTRTDEARIDACTDLATLERWLDQALAAQTVAEALRVGAAEAAAPAPARRRRAPRSS